MSTPALGRPQLREVDGVIALHVDAPGVTTATLSFACGRIDETFRTTGLAHLAEHLAMHGVGRPSIPHNATTNPDSTEFWARGPAAAVREVIEGVCAGIGAAVDGLPAEVVAKENAVLQAEGTSSHPLFHPVFERFGMHGPGLLGIEPVAPWALTADDVALWGRHRFVRSNAVLTVVGPWPDGIRLALPDGPRAQRPDFAPQQLTLPAQLGLEGFPGVSLSWLRPRRPGNSALDRILVERLEERLRHQLGHTYSVALEQVPVDARTVSISVGLDCVPGTLPAVVQAALEELSALATTGVTPDELERDAVTFELLLQDPEFAGVVLGMEAAHALDPHADAPWPGPRDPAEHASAIRGIDPAESRRVFAAALESLIVVHGEPAGLTPTGDAPGLATLPDCTRGAITGTTLRPRGLRGAFAATRLVWNDREVAIGHGVEWHVVELSDVVGLGVTGQGRLLIGSNGCAVPVQPDEFRGAEPLLRHLDAVIDPALRFPHEPYPGRG